MTLTKIIEYRIHYGEDGDSHDIFTYGGKDWRKWKQHIGEEGVQWIERVEDQISDCDGVVHTDYEILWESDECLRADGRCRGCTEWSDGEEEYDDMCAECRSEVDGLAEDIYWIANGRL